MIVYEFAQHLNLKEFQISKSEDGEYDIWIPDMNDPEFADPTDAATRIAEELDANNKKKLSDHQSGMIALSFRTSKSDILSIECNIAACETYAPKRLILAPKEGTDLRLCGFSIMAEPMTCPATAEQCKHVNLEVPTQTIGEVSIATLGSTVLSD
jgi:predicted Zn-ribbon and HTH transcriptional regulator